MLTKPRSFEPQLPAEPWLAASHSSPRSSAFSLAGVISQSPSSAQTGGATIEIGEVANNGSYNWVGGYPTGVSVSCQARVSGSNGARDYEDLSGSFTIAPPAGMSLELTAPDGGGDYRAGDKITITWTSDQLARPPRR